MAMSCLAAGFSTVVTSLRTTLVSADWMADRSCEDGLAVSDMVVWKEMETGQEMDTDWRVSRQEAGGIAACVAACVAGQQETGL